MPIQFHRRAAALCAVSLLALAGAVHAATPVNPPKPTPTTALTLGTGGQMPAEEAAVAIEHVDLKLKVIPKTKSIEGDATLTLAVKSALPRIVLDFDKNFAVSALLVDGKPATWTNPEGRLTINLPAPIQAGAKTTVQIRYAGQPHEAEKAPWDGGFVWKTTPTGEPWIASAVQGDGCDLFWPCIDFPTGEPLLVDFYVTVPAPLSAPAGGVLVDVQEKDGWRTFHWRQKQPDTYAVAVNVGPYDKLEASYKSRFGDSFPIEYWYLKSDDPAKAKALFAEFPTTLDFFEQMIGPYPFRSEKLGVVETPHLGMEHQTINAYGNAYKLDGRGYDWLLQHELAHEWFGNQMTNTTWDDMWLHEGLGSYMQPLYARWLNGDRYMESELTTMRLALHNTFPLVSGKPQDSATVYTDATGPGLDLYNKGALVAHSLRLLIGDEAFKRSLTRLVYGRPDPRPGNFEPLYASTPDFIRIVNEESHKDLGWFFATYVYQAALPKLVLTRDGDRATVAWADTAGTFPMPVEVEVDGQLRTLQMRDGKGDFAAPEGAHIILDPHNKVLRQLDFIDAYQARQREDAGSGRPRH